MNKLLPKILAAGVLTVTLAIALPAMASSITTGASKVTTLTKDTNNNATTSVITGSSVYDTATVAPAPGSTTLSLSAFQAAFNTKIGDANYNPAADFNSDGVVDLTDYNLFVGGAPSPISATSTPTGTVDFSSYVGTTCAGTSSVQSSVTLINGFATSSMTTVGTSGISYIVHYDGQTGVYLPSDSVCEPVSVITSTTTSTSTGSISGVVYNDLNRNGVKDTKEPTLSGWTINLYDNPGWSGPLNIAPFMTTVSDANGNYSFTNLPDGTYSIEEINQPGGLNQFTGDYSPVVVSGGSIISNKNFGNVTGNPYSNGHTGKSNKHTVNKKNNKGKSDSDKDKSNQGKDPVNHGNSKR